MPSFWDVVNKVIKEADIVLLVLDARFPEETRNREIEDKIKRKKKELIYILNKSDLLKTKFGDLELNLEPKIFVSSIKNLGTTKLRKLILKHKKRPLYVGVLGYPNTGKSTLINSLKQRKSAKTSPISGQTRGVQKIKLSKDVYLLDTPGVLPYEEKDEFKHSLISAKDPNRIKDPDIVATQLIEIIIKKDKKVLEKLYNIKIETEDSYEILELIAIKSNWLKKRGEPNIDLTSRRIIQDWQKGKIIV